MSHLTRATIVSAALAALLCAPVAGASAAGPQRLPDNACNAGTSNAGTHAPNRTSAEAMPHVEHAHPVAVPYCHHFNPTAEPPTAP